MKRLVVVDYQGRSIVSPVGAVVTWRGGGFTVSEAVSVQLVDDEDAPPVVYPLKEHFLPTPEQEG